MSAQDSYVKETLERLLVSKKLICENKLGLYLYFHGMFYLQKRHFLFEIMLLLLVYRNMFHDRKIAYTY